MLDDFTSSCDIANFFASKYQDLYTGVKFYKAEMDVVRGDKDSSVLDHDFTNECIITFKDVSRAIDKLNFGKGDGTGNHLKNDNR